MRMSDVVPDVSNPSPGCVWGGGGGSPGLTGQLAHLICECQVQRETQVQKSQGRCYSGRYLIYTSGLQMNVMCTSEMYTHTHTQSWGSWWVSRRPRLKATSEKVNCSAYDFTGRPSSLRLVSPSLRLPTPSGYPLAPREISAGVFSCLAPAEEAFLPVSFRGIKCQQVQWAGGQGQGREPRAAPPRDISLPTRPLLAAAQDSK